MSKQVKLKASTRAGVGPSTTNKLRREGLIPANIYGAKEPARALQIDARALNNVLSHASGENILVDLEIAESGSSTNRLALIQEVQHEPISGAVLHVDFHAVSLDEKLHAEVPVFPTGEPDGVRNFGGLLEQLIRAVEIECLPKDLPESIIVDVSPLGLGQSIHVRDLPMPEGVRPSVDGELTVFMVAAPRVETTPVADAGPAAQPEVIKEKKKDETSAPEKK
jgi:large subunit ribosomal protein L25